MVLSSMYKSLGLILCAMKRKGKEDEKEGGDGGGEEEEEERKKTEGSERGLNELRIRDTQMKITLTTISLCKVRHAGECGEQACMLMGCMKTVLVIIILLILTLNINRSVKSLCEDVLL